jgi:hypothetical protein
MHYFHKLETVTALSGMMFIAFAHERISSCGGYIATTFIMDDIDKLH